MLKPKDFIIAVVAALGIVAYSIVTKQPMLESILGGIIVLVVIPTGIFIKRKITGKDK